MQVISSEIQGRLTQAKSLARAGRLAEAEALYLSEINNHPDQPEARLGLIAHYHSTHAYDRALPYIPPLLAQLPHNAHLHFYAGACYHRLNQFEQARIHLETCLGLMQGHSLAHIELVGLELNLARLLENRAPFSALAFVCPPPKLFRLQIEVTTWCNLLCAGCPRTIDMEGNRWQNVHMPLDTFKTIVDTMPMSNTLCLQGVGESTLHPEFPEMVKYAAESKKYAFLTLNTNLLARPIEYYAQLKENGLNHISVSVDSLKQETAEACRKGTKVEKLSERLKELSQLYAPLPLSITIVASKRNLHDIPNTLRMLNRIGTMEVGIQALIIYDPDKGEDGNLSVALNNEDMQTLQEYTEIPYGNLTVNVEHDQTGKHLTRCMRPFLSPYITAEGYLTPCCTVEDPAVLSHTKIDGKPFTEIWQLPHIQSWLKHYALHSHTLCKGCCFFTG